MRSTRLYTSGTELELFIGPLETAVMRALWDKRQTSRQIWRYVRDHYETKSGDEIAYTTVTSTLTRLYEAGYVTRSGDRQNGYAYTPTHASEVEFVTAKINDIVDVLIAEYPHETARSFILKLKGSKQ